MSIATEAREEFGTYSVEHARVDLTAAHRLAVRDDLHEGSWNHLSLVVPERPDSFLVTPAAVHWSQVTASTLVEVSPDDADSLRDIGGLGWVAYRIHAPIHAALPEAKCVLHVHPPFSTALTMLEGTELEMAEQNALGFSGRIAYTEEYDGASSPDLEHGEGIASALGQGKTVLLLKNHGIVVVGQTVAEAYTDLYMLERAAKVLVLALSTGRKLQHVPLDVADKVAEDTENYAFKQGHFEAMKRVLDRTEPDYRD